MLEIFFQKLKKIVQWFFSTLSRKKSYRFLLIGLGILIISQWLFPLVNIRSLWTNAVGSNTNTDIQKSTIFKQAVYVNENKDFRIEFGNKLDKKDGSVRFTARPFQAEVPSGNKGALAKTKKYLTQAADIILPTPKKGITFSLAGAQKGATGNILAQENNEDEFAQGKEQNVVVKKEILPGVDVQYQRLGDEGLKEDIILKDPLTAPDTFLFDLQKDPGVKIYQPISFLNKNGQTTAVNGDTIFFTDERDRYLFNFEKPFAIDASGARTENVKIEIVKSSNDKLPMTNQAQNPNDKSLGFENWDFIGNWKFDIGNLINTASAIAPIQASDNNNEDYQIRLIVDPLWLSDPNRQYPIAVDPSIAHDTEGEFDAGLALNRIESIAGPKVQTNYHELPVDAYTVGLWHMNETSGVSVADASGNSYTGTSSSSSNITTSAQKLGAAARTFNGSSDKIAQSAGTNVNVVGDITVEAWIYPTTISVSGVVVHKDNQYSFVIQANKTVAWADSSNFNYANFGYTDIGLVFDKWQYLAITKTNGVVKIYLDGVEKVSKTFGGPLTSTSNIMHIGCYAGTSSFYYFPGSIDEVRISNIARTPEEIKANAQRRPYGVYTSSVLDFASTPSSIDSLQWTENGVATGDGETVFSATDLVAQWNFNETSGTTAVSGGTCGASCNGTLTNFASTASQDQAAGTGWTADNKRWGAGGLMFDGTNDYTSVADNTALDLSDDLTISTWVNMSSNNTNNGIVYKGALSSSQGVYSLGFYTGSNSKIVFRLNGSTTEGSGQLTGLTSLNMSTWYHVVATYSKTAGKMKIYINGVLDGENSYSTSISADANSLYLGCYYTSSFCLKGNMDATQIYSRALSADEILSNYNAGNIELQTRTGTDVTPDDGTNWEEWKSAASSPETQIDSLDSNPAPDYSTTTLLHGDGANASTVFPDNALFPKKFTPAGNAQVSTAQSKFGGASMLFDGSGDYLSAPDSDDWDFGSGDFSIDFWLRFDQTANTPYILGQSNGAATSQTNQAWHIGYSTELRFWYTPDGTTTNGVGKGFAWSPSNDNWYHVAIVRNGTDLKAFVDGTQIGSTQTISGSIYNSSRVLKIGTSYDVSTAYDFDGYIDEFRISKGVARWTSNFTAPTVAYDNLTHISTATDTTVKMEGAGSEKLISGIPQVDGKTVGLWHLDETGGSGAYIENSVPSTPFSATGGTITYTDSSGLNPRSSPPYSGGYTVHTFTSNGTFAVNGSVTVEYLVVAGGGGGGGMNGTSGGGSGGAGGYRSSVVGENSGRNSTAESKLLVSENASVVVGGGGAGGAYQASGGQGGNSSFSTITSTGGGAGPRAGTAGGNGGSGSGTNTTTPVGYGMAGQGYDGLTTHYGGGAGGTPTGLSSSITGTPTTRAAGGSQPISGTPIPGPANSGNGGMAAAWNGTVGAAGGSGIVIVRYKDSDTAPPSTNGTPTGTTIVNGIAGKARSFNGSSDFILLPASSAFNLQTFSIGAWVYPNTFPHSGFIFEKTTNGNVNTQYSCFLNNDVNNAIYFRTFNSVGTQDDLSVSQANSGITANAWNHVACVYNGSGKYIYVNGKQVAYKAYSQTLITNPAGTAIIGAYGSGTAYFFNGKIDEMRVSNVGLSAEEIAETYRMGRDHQISRTISSTDLSAKSKIPFYVAGDRAGTYLETTIGESAFVNYEPDSNTVGFWHLDEQSGSGAYLKDYSSYGNHGTPTGTTFAQGKIGKARSFNGSSDYTSFSVAAPSLPITIDMWINPASSTPVGIFDSAPGVQNVFRNYPAGYVEWWSASPQVALNLNANVWQHLVFILRHDGTNRWVDYYKNGILQTSASTVGNNTLGWTNFILGNINGGGAGWYSGKIDEVRISNIARSASDIRQAYEVGKRTHTISIDFASAPSAADIAGTSEDNAKTDTTFTLANDGMIENIFPGEKIIVKENYNGTEYILQGTVSSVTAGTRVITVDAWTGTVPPATSAVCGGSNTHCFSAHATVFKWQREYMDPTGSLATQRDAITRLTFRVTDGSEGRNIWLDDFKNTSNYLTAPAATSNVFSTANRYMQYRAIFSSTDTAVTPYLSSATVNYTEAPDPPTGVSATDGTYTDKVVVSWNAVGNATGYKVWNGSTWIDVGNVLTYDDTSAPAPTITPGTASASDGTYNSYVALSSSGASVSAGSVISYKVRAYNGGGDSADSSSDNGNRGAGSLSYQWQRSAADSDASYSDITGGTTNPYNDTDAPLDGSGRYFKCVLSSPGATNATSTADRGYVCGLPALTTQIPTSITYSTATANGNITNIGLTTPTVRGFKYGLTEADTWSVSENGSFSTGAYTLPLTGLSSHTGYFIRAYATNTCGTGYGSYIPFTTGINASPIELKKNVELRKNIELK